MTNDAERWPVGIPRNYDELHRDWGSYIQKRVQLINRTRTPTEELLAYVWEKVIASDLLRKFVDRARSALPLELTAREACTYLGITSNQWTAQMHFHHKGLLRGSVLPDGARTRVFGAWMPTPIRGKLTSMIAVFRFGEIVQVAVAETFTKHGLIGVLPPTRVVDDSNFAGYLRTAIHNYYCNYTRTKSRRERERPFDVFSGPLCDATSASELFGHQDDEGRRYPTSASEELLLSTQSDVDIRAELNRTVDRLRSALPESHQAVVIGLIEDGKTLPEALKAAALGRLHCQTVYSRLGLDARGNTTSGVGPTECRPTIPRSEPVTPRTGSSGLGSPRSTARRTTLPPARGATVVAASRPWSSRTRTSQSPSRPT
jgi:hypothetical protein